VQSIEGIKNGLKKDPARLPENLWNMLRSDSLIRTAQEEQMQLFQNAVECKAPETLYAKNIERGLKATLALWKETDEMKMRFVSSDNDDIDMAVDRKERTLNIHQRWLNYEEMHQKHQCRELVLNDCFVCDHIIEELTRSILGAMYRLTVRDQEGILRGVRNHLRWMPRDICARKGNQPGCLQVSWRDGETESISRLIGSALEYHIVLHEERCASLMTELLHGEPGSLLLLDNFKQ